MINKHAHNRGPLILKWNLVIVLLLSAVILLLTIYRIQILRHAIGSIQFNGYTIEAFLDVVVVPRWVEWIRRFAIACEIALILILLAKVRVATLPIRYKQYLVLISIWRILLTAWEALYPKWQLNYLLDQIGLVAILSGILMLIGFDKVTWQRIHIFLFSAAIVVSMTVIFEWLSWTAGNRAEGIKAFRGYSYILMSTLLFTISVPFGKLWLQILAGGASIFAFSVIAIATETRASLIYLIMLIGIYIYLRRMTLSFFSKATIFSLVLMLVLLFTWNVTSLITLSGGIGERLYEDTRSLQLYKFFSKIDFSEFLIGSPVAGHDPRFAGDANRWGIDSGIISILYVGGIPLLWLYLSLHVFPAFRAARKKLNAVDAAVVGTVIAYSIQMLSSEIPAISESYFIVLILMGRCIAINNST